MATTNGAVGYSDVETFEHAEIHHGQENLSTCRVVVERGGPKPGTDAFPKAYSIRLTITMPHPLARPGGKTHPGQPKARVILDR
jgi:hypothetical protein